ncbi:Uncharacterized conserved protein, DUF305 family [Hydrobacter penzbergensis]|uniref:Uncharacterized conserved protein, DUF305 family n=1 Tax=Hydrobacter penzbergensis TaxID=1235997 RepID=A0A8X8ICA0_9BACT|nr:DUF305 domain-containing protein [Hydrobacter penzbergensis]SDW14337.1 Uncharacterized conserved protein, DUF305 family [Hydrobacter penzbergensis]
MNLKIKSLALIAAVYLFTSCNNSTTAESDKKESTAHEHTDTAAHEHTTTENTTANTGTNLMSVMNSMMNKMHSLKTTGDFDVDWANMMIEHHQGGIDMAQVELSQGKDEKMKSKAQEIITKQKDEQQKLRAIISSYKPSGMKHGEGELEKHMKDMMNTMQSMKMSGDVDKDFATMMMHHHEHGIAMAAMEVKNGMNDELKKMAQKSITDQEKDVKEFKVWLNTHK